MLFCGGVHAQPRQGGSCQSSPCCSRGVAVRMPGGCGSCSRAVAVAVAAPGGLGAGPRADGAARWSRAGTAGSAGCSARGRPGSAQREGKPGGQWQAYLGAGVPARPGSTDVPDRSRPSCRRLASRECAAFLKTGAQPDDGA